MVHHEQTPAEGPETPTPELQTPQTLPGLSTDERVTEIMRDNLPDSPADYRYEEAATGGEDLFQQTPEWNPDIHFPFSYRDVASTSQEKAEIANAIMERLSSELPAEIDVSILEINSNQGNSNLSFKADTENGPVHIRVRVGDLEHYQVEKDRMELARSLSEAGSQRVAEVLAIGSLGELQGHSFSYSIQPRLDADPLTEVADPAIRRQVLKQVAEVVAPLHQLADEAPVFPKEESLQRLRETVTNALKPEHGERLIDAGIITETQWASLTDRFESFQWDHDIDPCVVHDDLNPNNILFNQSTGAVYVIDWELPTKDESRYKDNAGFASLGRFREMVSFTPILATDPEQASFVEGLGLDSEAFLSSPIKNDLDTIQLAMVTCVAGYFIDGAKDGNPGALKNLESIRDYFQDRLAA